MHVQTVPASPPPPAHSRRNGRNGENPSEDPALTGFYAEEVTRGQQEGEDPNYMLLSAGLKHYAGYEREADRFASNDNMTNFDLLMPQV